MNQLLPIEEFQKQLQLAKEEGLLYQHKMGLQQRILQSQSTDQEHLFISTDVFSPSSGVEMVEYAQSLGCTVTDHEPD